MLRKLTRLKEHQKYFTRDGKGPLPGASSVCKIGDDSGGLIHWAYKKGLAGEDYREERDDAAAAGDIGHGLAEAFLLGDELDISEYHPEAQRLGTIAFDKFRKWWEKQGMAFIHAELQMVSEDHLFGGTLDLLARDKDKRTCLVDFKTTKRLRTANGIQAGGYRIAYNENYPDDPIERICILRLPKDGKDVEPVWLPENHLDKYERSFLSNLSSYYAWRALEKIDPIALSTPKWFKRK